MTSDKGKPTQFSILSLLFVTTAVCVVLTRFFWMALAAVAMTVMPLLLALFVLACLVPSIRERDGREPPLPPKCEYWGF